MAKPPLVTDEPFDRVFSRPAASALVGVLRRTPITPNQVTGIATVFGIGIGVALALHAGVWAAACVLGYLAFDCADGQLARVRGGGGGYLGRAVDGVGDYVSALAMHVGLAVWLAALEGPLLGPAWALAAGLCAAWAAFLLDRYKRRYRDDMDDPERMRAEADATPGYRGRLIASMIPYSVRLAGRVRIPDLEAYQERVRTPMLLWLMGGPTSHFMLMAIFFVLERPLLYAWIAVGPMTLLSVVTQLLQWRAERRAPAVIEPRLAEAGFPAPRA